MNSGAAVERNAYWAMSRHYLALAARGQTGAMLKASAFQAAAQLHPLGAVALLRLAGSTPTPATHALCQWLLVTR
jgi:hypothetical protein